jgi:perosamine synthetase
MLRFVPPAGTPLSTAEVLRGAKAALFSARDFDRSLSSLAEQVHARSAVATRSGRSALCLVLKALHRLRPDRSLVVLPAYTCFTVPAAVVRAGLKPCLVDIDPETLDFDFSVLERVAASRPLCIVTSNLFGLPNHVERVREIAEAQGAFVVDDAAQALGASSRGEWAGLGGDAGVFSFGRGKALAAIEGGLAVTNSEEIGAALELEALMHPKASASHSVSMLLQMLAYGAFLRPRFYWIPNSIPALGLGATEFAPGFPISRMSEVTIALLTKIIGKLEETNAARVKKAVAIMDGLADQPEYAFPAPLDGCKPVYTRLPVIAGDAAGRDRAVANLREAGIGASPFYPSALCDIPDLEPFLAPELCHCPAAESVAARLFTLPTHAYVSQLDINRICDVLTGSSPRIADRETFVDIAQPPAGDVSAVSSPPPADGSHQSPAVLSPSTFDRESRVPNPESQAPDLEFRLPISEPRASTLETRAKRLLLIAFDFPPRRTSGIYRPTGLTKYLVRLGWQTTVLTVNADAKDLQDPALLERVPPETRVVRTRYFNFMAWEDSTAGAVRNIGALTPRGAHAKSSMVDQCLRRIAAFVRSCVYFPDDSSGWIPFGLIKAIQLARRERFSVVYSTSPPRSSLVIGLVLKLLFRVPWVAEFRDPWYPPEGKVRGWAEKRLLSAIGRAANAVVVMTSGHAEDFKSSGIPGRKIQVVPNGFDEEDFRVGSSRARNGFLKPGYLHFTHMGTVYPNCSGRFFEALKDFVREYPVWAKKIRVNIIGYPDQVVERYAEDEVLHPLVSIHGFVGHSQSIELMRSSHCLLLFWANRDFAQSAIAGKTYEYLRSGRTILAITYNGPMKSLIENGNAGWVIHPDDKHGMKQALRDVITASSGRAATRAAREEFAAQFRYDRLAAQMATVFDSVSTPKSSAHSPSPAAAWLPLSQPEGRDGQEANFLTIAEENPQASAAAKSALPR